MYTRLKKENVYQKKIFLGEVKINSSDLISSEIAAAWSKYNPSDLASNGTDADQDGSSNEHPSTYEILHKHIVLTPFHILKQWHHGL